MFNLIQNENMKIYRRIRTLILIGLIVLMAIAVAVISKNVGKPDNGADWRVGVQQQIEQEKAQLSGSGIPQAARDQLEADIKANEYRLQHDIPPADRNIWGGVLQLSSLITLVTIFTVIIAADIVAGEFGGGTIKLLLIRPASRTKILLSKYMATLAFSIFLLLVLFITAFIINGILYGFGDVNLPYIYASKDGVVHEGSMLGHALSTYALKCVMLIMIVTMAFMISTVFRSSSLSIGLSLLVMFLGNTVVFVLSKYDWIKYVLFANTDLTQYLEGRPLKPDMTLGFSITVLLVYFLVFNALSWFIFKKRDVAA